MTLEELDAEALQGVGSSEVLAAVCTPPELSIEGQEELARLIIAEDILKNYRELFLCDTSKIIADLPTYPKLLEQLENHVRNFGWIPLNFAKPLWDLTFFIELFRAYAKEAPDLSARKLSLLNYTSGHIAERTKIYNRLDAKTKILVNVLEATSFTRFYRANMFSRAYFSAFPILWAVAKKVGVSFATLPYFTATEIAEALANEVELIETRGLERKNTFVIRILDNHYAQFDGAEARRVADEEFPVIDVSHLAEVKGRCAYPGVVVGTVRIVRDAREGARVKPGDILVCKETNPDLVMLMERAGAIVTDEGGVTSHAAIVSREMKKPCVTGTRQATAVFKDGDTIEVDATNGIVKKL